MPNNDHRKQSSNNDHLSLQDRVLVGSLKKKGKKKKRTLKSLKPNWDAGNSQPTSAGVSLWQIAPIVVVLLIVFGGILFGIKYYSSTTAPAAPSRSAAILPPETIDPSENEPPVFTRPPQEVAEAFISADSIEEKLKWVRNPDDIRTRIKLYPTEAVSGSATEIIPMGVASSTNHVFARFLAKLTGDSKRLLCVIPTDDGPKVDWDAYARYTSAPWVNILDGSAQSAEVRVFLQPGYYYVHSYRDDSVWLCYQASSPDLELPLYFYASKDSKRGKLLSANFPVGTRGPIRMTLSISSEKDTHKNRQFTIDRVHAFGWVRSEKDIEDTWIPSLLNEDPQ